MKSEVNKLNIGYDKSRVLALNHHETLINECPSVNDISVTSGKSINKNSSLATLQNHNGPKKS